ncbi:Non-specific serine/threonine protein kinase [Bertholletia excelsa]
MTPNYNSNDNDDEISITYDFTNSSMLLRMFVDELGLLQWQDWDENSGKWVRIRSIPTAPCDHYGHCGSFGNCDPSTGVAFECTCLPGYKPQSARDWQLRDGTGGCVRKRQPVSTCDKGDRFMTLARAKLPDVLQAHYYGNLSPETCQETCLKNCSCTAYTTGEEVECITWHGDLNDSSVLPKGGLELYIRVDSIELAPQSKKTKSSHGKKEAIAAGSIVVVLLLIIFLVYWLVSRRKSEARLNILQASEEHNLELPIFDFATIVRATNNFSIQNKIGEGGFGPVYKGCLSTEKEIAVKRLSINSRQGVNEFTNEVILIAKLQHRNLVRLLGCCSHREERMLVYEYMPNGSLDLFIFGLEKKKHKLLTWRQRLDIIIGIARGLLYLHQDSRLKIIHRDLKTSNILLDSEMNPKISDFGLAKVVGGDQSSTITRRVVGTYGYMSPEYVIDGVFSTKLDVFSLGVIILEIMAGQRNRLFRHPDHDLNLLGHAWQLWVEGKALELLDPHGEGSIPMLEVLRFIQVALLCVQKVPEDRPNMSFILLMLTTETAKLPQPKQPGFYTERNDDESDIDPISKTSSSINEMTTTQVKAR